MFGPPGGIDQSKKPRPNSIYDGVNLDTSKGYWSSRPGLYRVKEYAIPLVTNWKLAGAFEFIADTRFDTCHYNAIIYPIVKTASTGGITVGVYELKNLVDAPAPTGHSTGWGWDDNIVRTEQERFSAVQSLLRYKEGEYDEGTDRYAYTPCLVMTNGRDPVLVYHQKDGEGVTEPLEAMVGGTDRVFLTEVPKGKWIASFMERTWLANVPGNGNRLHFSTTDTALVFSANCWAGDFYYDIGSGQEEITGIIPFHNVLVVFKENSIWTVSGTGEGGQWNIQCVDSQHGALNGHCIDDLGDRLVFMSKSGAYEWNGNISRSISHPYLEDLWRRLNWSQADHKVPSVVYDEQNQRLMFGVSITSKVIDSWLIYDLKLKSWNRWGAWYDQLYSFLPGGDVATYRTPDWAVATKKFAATPQVLFFLERALFAYSGAYDYDYTNRRSIHWFIRTQRYFIEDPSMKLLRYFKVSARQTGDWNMLVLPLVNGESIESSMRRRSPKKWNIVIDEISAQEHQVDGTSVFQTAADGPVDGWFYPLLYKHVDSQALVASSGADKIKFSGSISSSLMGGMLLILPEDKNPVRRFKMYEFASRLYNTGKYGDASMENLSFKEVTVGFRELGKNFAFLLTNAGIKENNSYAEESSSLELLGWGLWVIPRGTLRPMAGRTIAVGRTADPAKEYTP
jgi:hypothetical protein